MLSVPTQYLSRLEGLRDSASHHVNFRQTTKAWASDDDLNYFTEEQMIVLLSIYGKSERKLLKRDIRKSLEEAPESISKLTMRSLLVCMLSLLQLGPPRPTIQYLIQNQRYWQTVDALALMLPRQKSTALYKIAKQHILGELYSCNIEQLKQALVVCGAAKDHDQDFVLATIRKMLENQASISVDDCAVILSVMYILKIDDQDLVDSAIAAAYRSKPRQLDPWCELALTCACYNPDQAQLIQNLLHKQRDWDATQGAFALVASGLSKVSLDGDLALLAAKHAVAEPSWQAIAAWYAVQSIGEEDEVFDLVRNQVQEFIPSTNCIFLINLARGSNQFEIGEDLQEQAMNELCKRTEKLSRENTIQVLNGMLEIGWYDKNWLVEAIQEFKERSQMEKGSQYDVNLDRRFNVQLDRLVKEEWIDQDWAESMKIGDRVSGKL